MPRASRTAYSRRAAAVAAYNVWLVTAAPTINPNKTAQPMAMPALVLVNHWSCERIENSWLVNADIVS